MLESEILSGWPGLTMPKFGFLRCTCGVREKAASWHKTVATEWKMCYFVFLYGYHYTDTQDTFLPPSS